MKKNKKFIAWLTAILYLPVLIINTVSIVAYWLNTFLIAYPIKAIFFGCKFKSALSDCIYYSKEIIGID